ncbi:hypothetical protein GCM10008927_03200 [Amylibacter ulvae]|uniref:DUF3179 domain-containing protein n=1 Tax=Paramylibacter ulvae TaxID=1651968 RepID=A0ABQ3CSJ8_9RHOB|nr:DUF3179 domain-containing protein [Amylibacter ulvae]GHA42097.1 hypothetical protein GCM10008927_03200 [Amylibacter ulvae]
MKKTLFALVCLAFASAAMADVRFWKMAWKNTDFGKTIVDFDTILDGGPGKDGIPAITDPVMVANSDERELRNPEPVMVVHVAGQVVRAYPVRYLMWHEIVNDRVGDVPIAVTFCPLCNSGVVFDRRLDQVEYELGVSGLLRNSDMIMYDRQTESWWQQFTGDAIVGEMVGKKLTKLPSYTVSWGAYLNEHPDGLVMSSPKHNRSYGSNPYAGYDTGTPFLYRGENPPHGINPLERVVVVEQAAWPLQRVRKEGRIVERGIVIEWDAGMASALDTREIAKGRDVGSVRVTDQSSGGNVVHDVGFAFAFHAFHPDGKWMLGN